jgi:hypothetical protein
MTSAEWADAFRKGDPEAIGRAMHAAIDQAGAELLGMTQDSWDDLDDDQRGVAVRAGQILREHGLIIPGDTQPDFPGMG